MARAKPAVEGRPRVLGVEPDAVTRALVALYLEPCGLAVELAADVPAALRQPCAEALVVVCSEHALGRASPAERQQLREAIGTVPVVALLEPGAAPEFTRTWSSVREQLTKPIRAESLLTVLQAIQGPAAAVRPPSRTTEPGNPGENRLVGFERLMAELELEGGSPFTQELVASFLGRSPQYLDDMAAGMSAREYPRVDAAAHAMKGMCGNLRFERLVKLSDAVRKAAMDQDGLAGARLLIELQNEYEVVAASVRQRWSQDPKST